ncbi:MAG: hypothetical protein PHF69_05540 [Candidatus Omnitrophica bacterium]|nr:hypothetical protein [Candidatus Omnitrophota bacterium]
MKDLTDQGKIKKGFFARMIDKLDKKMQEKSKSKSCCNDGKSDKKSCCS